MGSAGREEPGIPRNDREGLRKGGRRSREYEALQVYRQVREYHERYPDKAIVAWHAGAGPIPLLMAGGAQALMRNPSGGHGQGRTADQNALDGFVREYLAASLMSLQPRDGVAADAENAWCLADDRRATLLLYSLSGPSIQLLQALPQRAYTGIWFDPRTGNTRPLTPTLTATADVTIQKPTTEAWLLLLRR